MLANYFEYWMSFVTFLSAIGFLQAFLSENVLADRQFSLAKRQGPFSVPLYYRAQF